MRAGLGMISLWWKRRCVKSSYSKVFSSLVHAQGDQWAHAHVEHFTIYTGWPSLTDYESAGGRLRTQTPV